MKLITLYPAIIPESAASWIPASMAGMYSLGIAPPTIAFSNVYSPSVGSISITAWPYCPLPPDCLAYLASALTGFLIVSL